MTMEKVALFAGTFDPFTKGHHALIKRALPLFDKIIIAIGNNSEKRCMFTIEERVATIEKLYTEESRVEVKIYNCLTVDFARKVGATALLRGARSIKDFEYERELADINLKIGGIDTVLLISEAEHASVSSSVVRELIKYGKDVSQFLP